MADVQNIDKQLEMKTTTWSYKNLQLWSDKGETYIIKKYEIHRFQISLFRLSTMPREEVVKVTFDKNW